MDWIHCNSCFVQPGSNATSAQFVLTTCGHIYCERCNTSASSNACRVCDAQYTTTPLSSQLREEVREFFIADPIVLLNKFVKVLQYQKDHRDRFNAHLRRAQAKYEAAKREIQRFHEEIKQMRKKIHTQQQEIAWYKMQRDRARARASSTPNGGDMGAGAGAERGRQGRATISPFGAPADTQRSALQQMQGSGMGNSRLTLAFTGTTPASRDTISPFSIPSTPVNHNSRSAYRTNRTFMSTPESTPSAMPAFMSPDSPSPSGDRSYSQQGMQPNGLQSPPSRGTPTDALKILSLAYKNKHPRQ